MADQPLALEYIRAIRDDRTLLPSEKLAAILMASHAGHDGTNAHPGIEMLAAELGLKERQTKTIVKSLTKKGWLALTAPGRGDRHLAAVYRMTIPQGAADCTLDPEQDEPRCNPLHAKVQPSAGQGATHCTPNQPVEITKEIPVSQVSDVTDVGASLSGQELTAGQDGHPSNAGAAGDGWEDWPSGEALVEHLNEVLAVEWPREDYPDAEPFDARFLRGGAKRLDELVRAVNRHRFDMEDLVAGMFFDGIVFRCPEDGRADHKYDLVTHPARIIGKVMSGEINKFVAYGLRGKKLNATLAAYQASKDKEREEAAA